MELQQDDKIALQKAYKEYIYEKNKRKEYANQIPFDLFVWEHLEPEQRKFYRKYWTAYLRKKQQLEAQKVYPTTIIKILKKRIKDSFLPIECSIFLREHPKQHSKKDALNFYGL